MGIADKAEHEFEDLKGKAEENIGDVTGNENLHTEGLIDQAFAEGDEAPDDWRAALAHEDADQPS
jgi:uncharacterized protein YjbJ (UPF0337 family)